MADDIFLLDTNIISNSSKRRPHPKVSEWLMAQSRVAIPFAVMLEVETGIAEKHRSDPEKAEALWEWMDQLQILHARMFFDRPDYDLASAVPGSFANRWACAGRIGSPAPSRLPARPRLP